MNTDVADPTTLLDADKALEQGSVPAPSVPEPSVETAPPPEPGKVRDERGRFTEAPPSEPGPSATPEPGAPPESPAEAATPEEAGWQFQSEGQPFGLDGALKGEDGVFIPEPQRTRAEELIRHGLLYEGRVQRWLSDRDQERQHLEGRLTAAESRIQAAEAEKQHVLGHFEQLIEASAIQIEQGVEVKDTPLGQWLLRATINWPVLKAQAEARGIELRSQATESELRTIRERQQEAEQEPLMLEALSDWVLHYGQQAGLDRPVLEQIYADLQQPQFRSQLFVRAPRDDVRAGIRKGELVINHAVVEQELQRVRRWVQPKGGAPMAAAPAPKAESQVPVRKPTPPPTVSATRGPAPRKPVPEPKTLAEADALLEEGGYDL